MSFKIHIHSVSGHCFIEIDFVAVEIRTVDTGKLGDTLAILYQSQTAAAAHAGTIDHDRVHGNGDRYIIWLGSRNDELHHDQRTDRDDHIESLTFFQHFLQRNGDIAMLAIRTVVRHDEESVGTSLELVFQDDDILVTETDDGSHICP